MKKIIIMLFIIIELTFHFYYCYAFELYNQHIIDNRRPFIVLKQEVKADKYKLLIPKDWDTKFYPINSSYIFSKDGKEIGGVFPRDYENEISINFALPNHTSIKESRELKGYLTKTLELKINHSSGAGLGDNSSTNWIYFFFLFPEDKKMYILYINNDLLDEGDIIKIARSFKII